MYAFSIVAMPLSFLAVAAWFFQQETEGCRAFFRGLLFGLPGTLVWLLLGPLYRPAWGSFLLVLSFFTGHWLLPLGLTTLFYVLAVGFQGLRKGVDHERALAFFAGSLSVFSLGRTILAWGEPNRVVALLVPVMAVAGAYAFVVLLEEAVKDGFPGAIWPLAIALAGSLLGATGTALFYMRLEWLGFVVCALCTAGASLLAWSRLARGARGRP